jgi:hypothetical protein
MENTLIFYNILLFFLICMFIPSLYNYMYNNFIGRIVLILLIIYFSKINFYLGLIFITIIIILSSSLYEGFTSGQNAIITTTNTVPEDKKTNPNRVFDYFRNFYCDPSNKNTPNASLMNQWNNLANTSKDSNVVAVAKKNIENANMICSASNISIPDKHLEWNTDNAKIQNKCMGGWKYIGGACYGPPGAMCSPYYWDGMRSYTPGGLSEWMSGCRANNTDVALANAEKLRNAENSCGSGGPSILFSISNPRIPTLNVNNFPSLAGMKYWEMDVEFTCNGGSNSWRALIGDMYNNTSYRGWGLWVSSSNGIHWSWKSRTWDAPRFVVKNGEKYKVTITQNDRLFTATLINLNSKKTESASTSVKDVMTYGPVTIGGWINYSGENFPGTIQSIVVRKTEQASSSDSISSRIFNKPTCLVNNMDTMCSSIKSIDSQINNVLTSNTTDQSFQRHAQFLKNTYDEHCVKPSDTLGPLLR